MASCQYSRSPRGHSVAVILWLLLVLAVSPLQAQQKSGCFMGRDSLGQPAKAWVHVERYGDWFEIYGQIYSSGENQTYRFKVDGHSGAGRLFQRHEFEGGAVYMDILNLSEQEFVFQVEGYGRFRFRRTPC